VRELADIVKETVPNTQIEYAADAGPDKRCYRVDCSKIQKVLPAFKPVWSARSGAVELLEAYRKIGLKVEDFEGIRYKRIAHIKALIEEGALSDTLRWTAVQPDESAAMAVTAGAI
jgi:hypothetical protein